MWAFLVLAIAMAEESMVTAQAILSRQLNSVASEEELEKAAILGMVETIENKTGLSGSTVLTEDEFQREKRWKEGKREGYGLRVQLIPRQGFFVDGVIPNSPAEKAGIKPDDVIVSFGGLSLMGLPPQSMLNILNQEFAEVVSVGFVCEGIVRQADVQKDVF